MRGFCDCSGSKCHVLTPLDLCGLRARRTGVVRRVLADAPPTGVVRGLGCERGLALALLAQLGNTALSGARADTSEGCASLFGSVGVEPI